MGEFELRLVEWGEGEKGCGEYVGLGEKWWGGLGSELGLEGWYVKRGVVRGGIGVGWEVDMYGGVCE